MSLFVGIGYDVHRFTMDRSLILGGVTVPFEMGLAGHSDADVLTHAVMDALLGAACLGDIGLHFPDSDPKYKNANSLVLLEEVCQKLKQKGFRIINIDTVIIAEKPKLSPYFREIADNYKKITETDFINIKATTEEGLGFTGKMEGIAAKAVCTLNKIV